MRKRRTNMERANVRCSPSGRVRIRYLDSNSKKGQLIRNLVKQGLIQGRSDWKNGNIPMKGGWFKYFLE